MDEMEKTMLRLRLGHLREAIRGNLLQLEYETGLTPRPDALVLDDPDYADIDHIQGAAQARPFGGLQDTAKHVLCGVPHREPIAVHRGLPPYRET
jgi:hypothetical protein